MSSKSIELVAVFLSRNNSHTSRRALPDCVVLRSAHLHFAARNVIKHALDLFGRDRRSELGLVCSVLSSICPFAVAVAVAVALAWSSLLLLLPGLDKGVAGSQTGEHVHS